MRLIRRICATALPALLVPCGTAFAGSIGGTVTNEATGQPVQGICVHVTEGFVDVPGSPALTNASGSWSITGLEGGYRVQFVDCRPTGSLVGEWYDDATQNDAAMVGVGPATAAVVNAAIDAGVTVFDTADLYGDGASEEYLGRALGRRRDDVVIVTKFGMRRPPDGLSGGSPEWVARACRDSLARLATDRIDVYLLHQPDPATPIADTLEALGRLVADGLVREIGCSNFSADQLDDAATAADAAGVPRFATVQNEYSLVERAPEAAVLPACERLGLAFLAYAPLDGGALASDAPAALRGLLDGSPSIVALPGAATVAELEQDVAA
jgi:aryl-alcohol dehydrogenase-like predicted oxidoreductase